jgi:hypothetical protein
MSLAILFHFLCTQHVSDINISFIRSLRLCRWITTSVVLFSVRCVLEIWCGWVWVVSVLQAVLIGDTKTNDFEVSVLNLIVIYSHMQLLWFPNILKFSVFSNLRDTPVWSLWIGVSLGWRHVEQSINNCPTRCNTKQSIYYSASSLHLFWVSTTPIIRSTQNCNYSLRYWSYFFVQLPPSNVPKLGHVEGR